MDNFLIGFLGAILGGASLAIAVFIAYQYEISQKDKLANNLIKEFQKDLAQGKVQKDNVTPFIRPTNRDN